jgi:heat shock protein HslJ
MRAVLVAPLLMLTACATPASPPLQLAGTQWRLEPAGAGPLGKAGAGKVTAAFTASQVSGHGGCNQYSASYTLAGATLSVGPVAATKRFCGDGGSEVEKAWFAALGQKLDVSRTNGRLELRAKDGGVLRLAPAKP